MRNRVAVAEDATVVIDNCHEEPTQHHEARVLMMSAMFRAMHAVNYSFEKDHLGLLHLRTMLAIVALRLGESMCPALELLLNILGIYGAKRSGLVDLHVHEPLPASINERDDD